MGAAGPGGQEADVRADLPRIGGPGRCCRRCTPGRGHSWHPDHEKGPDQRRRVWWVMDRAVRADLAADGGPDHARPCRPWEGCDILVWVRREPLKVVSRGVA